MSDKDEIWAAVQDMYAGFLAKDRARIDQHIHEDATVWDSEEPDLAVGKAELDAIRERRPTDPTSPVVVDLQASSPVIDVWGDTAVCRHLLDVTFAGDVPPQHVRNTGVWRRVDGRWVVVHNHEDVLAS